MNYHASTMVSPISETPAQPRSRKAASTGGNRSWSEQEENYLLQTRMQKMPYKHIAAYLKKTELACRLHYHQLSHGSHRRKRSSSVSSHTSSGSAGQSPHIPQYPLPEHDEYAISSRQSSPLTNYSVHGSPVPSVHASPARSHPHHKMLLPKPSPLTPRQSPEPYGLRINTSDNMVRSSPVDTDRLRAIYESRRASFWAQIASEYGTDISPAQLEEIWRQGGALGRPPTPGDSPERALKPSAFAYQPPSAIEHHARSFTPVNLASAISMPDRVQYILPAPLPSISRTSTWSSGSSSSSNVPIASLLNEDR